MNSSFFAYGSLIYPEIMFKVTGCAPPTIDARLNNYSRYLVKGTCFPGITHNHGGYVYGKLYSEVNQKEFKKLDLFEGKIYERIEVEILTSSRALIAQTFIILPTYKNRLSNKPWSPKTFRRKHYEGFIKDIT